MSDFDTLMHQYEMGETYKRITEEMGPSAQLIAFVNYSLIDFDNAGLESLEVDVDHQLTLEQIDNNQSFDLAMEALADNVRNLAKGLGAASGQAQKAYLYGGHSTLGLIGNIGQLASRAALSATSHLVKHVEPYDEVALTYNDTLELFKLEEHIADMVPHEFTEKAWLDFHKEVHPAIKKYNRSWVSWGLAVPKDTVGSAPVEWSESGWTEPKYKALQERLNRLKKEVDKLSEHYSGQLNTIALYLKNAGKVKKEDRAETKRVATAINKLVVSTGSMFSRTHQRISVIQDWLDEVKDCLEKQ